MQSGGGIPRIAGLLTSGEGASSPDLYAPLLLRPNSALVDCRISTHYRGMISDYRRNLGPGLKMGNAIGYLIWGLITIASLASWFTHLYVCFTDERWGFLIAGAIFFPVAIVHGIGIWLGVW